MMMGARTGGGEDSSISPPSFFLINEDLKKKEIYQILKPKYVFKFILIS
jgi:hypothetical protein